MARTVVEYPLLLSNRLKPRVLDFLVKNTAPLEGGHKNIAAHAMRLIFHVQHSPTIPPPEVSSVDTREIPVLAGRSLANGGLMSPRLNKAVLELGRAELLYGDQDTGLGGCSSAVLVSSL